MRRAEILRPLELPRVEVDPDDRVRARELGGGDRRVADAAAAEHRDRVVAPDVAGVRRRRRTRPSRRSRASPAAVGLGLRVDLRGLARGDERLLGERADAERGRERACRRRASSSAARCAWRSSTTAGRAGTPGTRRTPRAS